MRGPRWHEFSWVRMPATSTRVCPHCDKAVRFSRGPRWWYLLVVPWVIERGVHSPPFTRQQISFPLSVSLTVLALIGIVLAWWYEKLERAESGAG